jgi:probable DNA repair protein
LLELSDDLLAHLNHGGTLIVPTRQRAAAVRLAHTAAQLAAGHRVWNSPDVLSWTGWIERVLDAASLTRADAPRRLRASEEWLWWHEAVEAAGAESAVPFTDALVESVRRAVLLLDDYALPLHAPTSPESALLLGARRGFRQRCAERGVLGTTSWQDLSGWIEPVSATRVVGFPALGPARRRWLEQLGARIDASAPNAASGLSLQECQDPDSEAAAAAEWCAGLLGRDPHARMLVVVPRLAEQTCRWQRALDERLAYRSILDSGSSADDAAFALEGGAPLRSTPLMASALQLIALGAGRADFDTLSAALRSPYCAAVDPAARLRVDLWLRDHDVDTGDPALLRGLLPALRRDAGDAAADALAQLLAALAPDPAGTAGFASPAGWAAAFARALAACGWPGSGLTSPEQQARQRFDELLNDCAALDAQPRRLSAVQASLLLEQLADRSAFEPASDDVPVTLSASLDDPIARYDGIWIAGLSAEAWPAPVRPDPMIPMALQLAAGLPGASSDGQRELALAALARWGRAARQCRLSFARSEGDLRCSPSPLLAGIASAAAPCGALSDTFLLEVALAQRAPPLEPWSDESGPRWRGPGVLRGGARLLELQARCPFRSFAELRLRARPVPHPVPGVDARRRGQIVHRALELFWEALGDSGELQRRGEEAAHALARDCVARALLEAQASLPGLLPPRLLAAEGERTQLLMARLREWERGRAPFVAEALEFTQALQIGGATLQLRLDRVDRLEDGARIVIDYKSGAVDVFDAAALRPVQPQLPAYGLATGPQTRAVLALQLAPSGLRLRGVADRADRLLGLEGSSAEPQGWAELRQHWARELGVLVAEFLSGDARVAPQPGACEHCHLSACCRIEHPRTGRAA